MGMGVDQAREQGAAFEIHDFDIGSGRVSEILFCTEGRNPISINTNGLAGRMVPIERRFCR